MNASVFDVVMVGVAASVKMVHFTGGSAYTTLASNVTGIPIMIDWVGITSSLSSLQS